MNTRTKGNIGEKVAEKHLKKQKYKILDRNYVCAFGEVDIIAKDKDYYVFVEVKSRTSDSLVLPRMAVNVKKQQKIIACAKYWLSTNNLLGSFCRFDVVEVVDGKVTHLQNAFSADYVRVKK